MHQLARIANMVADIVFNNGTTAPRDLYLRKDGKDSNNGLTPATAKLTADGILELLPFNIKHLQHIHIGPGTYLPPSMPTKSYSERVIWNGDGAGDPGQSVVVATAAAGADTNEFQIRNDTTNPMVVNAHRGQTIRVEIGGIESFRQVAENDANFYSFDREVTGLAPDDDYTIIANTVIFEQDTDVLEVVRGDGPAAAGFTVTPGSAGVGFLQITWAYDGSSSFPRTVFSKITAWMYGCNIDDTGIVKCTWQSVRSVLYCGGDDSRLEGAQLPLDLGLVTDSNQWGGYGLAELGSSDTLSLEGDGPSASIRGYFVMGSIFVNSSDAPRFVLMGRIYGGGFIAPVLVGSGYIESGNGSRGRLVIEGVAAAPDCIFTFDSGDVHTLGNIDFRPFTGARLMVADAGSRITETDTGNQNVGSTTGPIVVEAVTGGIVHFNQQPNYDGPTANTGYVARGSASSVNIGKDDLVNDGDSAFDEGAAIRKVSF